MSGGAMVAIMAAVTNATQASGTIIHVSEEVFRSIVLRADVPVVVHASGSFFSKKHKYLTSYKGFAFHTKSHDPIVFESAVELIEAGKIWVPEM